MLAGPFKSVLQSPPHHPSPARRLELECSDPVGEKVPLASDA